MYTYLSSASSRYRTSGLYYDSVSVTLEAFFFIRFFNYIVFKCEIEQFFLGESNHICDSYGKATVPFLMNYLHKLKVWSFSTTKISYLL